MYARSRPFRSNLSSRVLDINDISSLRSGDRYRSPRRCRRENRRAKKPSFIALTNRFEKKKRDRDSPEKMRYFQRGGWRKTLWRARETAKPAGERIHAPEGTAPNPESQFRFEIGSNRGSVLASPRVRRLNRERREWHSVDCQNRRSSASIRRRRAPIGASSLPEAALLLVPLRARREEAGHDALRRRPGGERGETARGKT